VYNDLPVYELITLLRRVSSRVGSEALSGTRLVSQDKSMSACAGGKVRGTQLASTNSV
jgi:hypothetical protein